MFSYTHVHVAVSGCLQVDPYASDPKNRHLFQHLERLILAQEESIARIRESEKEVGHMHRLLVNLNYMTLYMFA